VPLILTGVVFWWCYYAAFICSLYSFSPFACLMLMVEFYNIFADSKKKRTKSSIRFVYWRNNIIKETENALY
jgi:hypothetical protein